MTTIDELNRQRAERHRLVDAEYDERIRLVQDRCKHEPIKWYNAKTNEFVCEGNECKHCGAPMPELLSNT